MSENEVKEKKLRSAPQLANDAKLKAKAQAKREAKASESNPEQGDALSADQEKARTRRKSFGSPESKLGVPEREGYVRRWVRDDSGRLAMFEDKGYRAVLNDEVSGSVGSKSTDPKEKVYVHGGVRDDGTGLRLYLMEQKREWYDEDQKLKQKPVDATDQAIREGSLGSQGLQDHEKYAPNGGIKIK